MTTQTELFMRDYHQYDLVASDIDQMPNKIKYDIISDLRETAEETRNNELAIDC